jgi:hypothetical protein
MTQWRDLFINLVIIEITAHFKEKRKETISLKHSVISPISTLTFEIFIYNGVCLQN